MSACRVSKALLAIACLTFTAACEDNEEQTKVLDAVVVSVDAAFNAIEGDTATWITEVEPGQELNGMLTNANNGTLSAFGWRSTTQYDNGTSTHIAFGEKLFFSFSEWNANGMNLSGSLVVTRHHMDFGPTGGNVDDASRTTSYLGSVSASGDVEGSFDVDVHAQAAGNTLWTCGLINDVEIEHGACF